MKKEVMIGLFIYRLLYSYSWSVLSGRSLSSIFLIKKEKPTKNATIMTMFKILGIVDHHPDAIEKDPSKKDEDGLL